jgi:hypothetical protein
MKQAGAVAQDLLVSVHSGLDGMKQLLGAQLETDFRAIHLVFADALPTHEGCQQAEQETGPGQHHGGRGQGFAPSDPQCRGVLPIGGCLAIRGERDPNPSRHGWNVLFFARENAQIFILCQTTGKFLNIGEQQIYMRMFLKQLEQRHSVQVRIANPMALRQSSKSPLKADQG